MHSLLKVKKVSNGLKRSEKIGSVGIILVVWDFFIFCYILLSLLVWQLVLS